jgi:hypothetical protein
MLSEYTLLEVVSEAELETLEAGETEAVESEALFSPQAAVDNAINAEHRIANTFFIDQFSLSLLIDISFQYAKIYLGNPYLEFSAFGSLVFAAPESFLHHFNLF